MPLPSRPLRWVVLLPLLLTGCFQPMYAPLSGRNVVAQLQAIQVEPIQGLMGHYLANDLRFWFNGSGASVPPQYRLVVTVTETTSTPLVDTITGIATASDVTAKAEYQLFQMGQPTPLLKGNALSVAAYDRSDQRFANIRAARDAEIRNANTLADMIRTRITAELATR